MPGRTCRTIAAVCLTAWLGAACSEPPPVGPDPPPGPVDNVIAGVDLDVLFAPPTPLEIRTVRGEWASRPSSIDSMVTLETLDLGGRETVHVVAGLDASGRRAFVGAIRQPPRTVGDQRARPLLLVLPGRDITDLDEAIALPPFEPTIDGEFVTVVLGYRGGSLRIAGRTYASDLTAEPYDRDADDALALTAHARARAGLDRSDPTRLVVAGWGRGGAVALLATERGLEADVVLSLAAPGSFFLPGVKADARRYLRDQNTSSLPAVASVLDASAGAVRDGRSTLPEARLALLRRSAAPFVDPPPFLIAAHGVIDLTVPIEHGRELELTNTPGAVYIEREEAGHDTILTDAQVASVVTSTLCERVLVSEPVCGG